MKRYIPQFKEKRGKIKWNNTKENLRKDLELWILAL